VPAVVVVPLAGIALAGAAWFATNSSMFHARHIEVTGTSHVKRGEVLRLTGLRHSTNVLWLDLGRVAESVETDPWIASADVARSLPGTVRIEVHERIPAATMQVGSTWLLVSTDGTVLDRLESRPRLPELPGLDRVTLGARIQRLAGAAAIAGGMSPWLRQRVRTVSPVEGGAVQLELPDGATVLFGQPSEIDAKDQALAGILQWASDRGVRLARVDVRSPLAPVVRAVGHVAGIRMEPKRRPPSTETTHAGNDGKARSGGTRHGRKKPN